MLQLTGVEVDLLDAQERARPMRRPKLDTDPRRAVVKPPFDHLAVSTLVAVAPAQAIGRIVLVEGHPHPLAHGKRIHLMPPPALGALGAELGGHDFSPRRICLIRAIRLRTPGGTSTSH